MEQPIRHWPGLGKARADRSTAVAFLKTTMKSAFMWIEGLFDWAFGSKWNPFYCLGALGATRCLAQTDSRGTQVRKIIRAFQ